MSYSIVGRLIFIYNTLSFVNIAHLASDERWVENWVDEITGDLVHSLLRQGKYNTERLVANSKWQQMERPCAEVVCECMWMSASKPTRTHRTHASGQTRRL
jgi:hypothetical protein